MNALDFGASSFPAATDRVRQALVHALPSDWTDVEYRHATMEAHIEQGLAWQIRVNREERGWTQSDLAHRMGTRQSAISKLEDTEGGNVQLGTLIRAAKAFDCALVVRFVPWSVLASVVNDLHPDRLYAPSFGQEFDLDLEAIAT